MPDLRKALDSQSVLPWEDNLNIDRGVSNLPSLSIVIPIYNAGAHLEKTLRSLLCNDLEGVELILMDGGSTDSTMEIVEHYKEMFSFIHSAPDDGQSDAINRGYDKASGKILYWLNGDDLILPNTLNKVREYFGQNPKCHVLVGDAYLTELDLTPINHFKFSTEKLTFDYLLDYASNHLIQPSVFFLRKAWDEVGPLVNEYHYAMDANLFIGMAKQYEFHHLSLDIAYSVYHEDCKTRGARAESITELALVQAKHGGFEFSKKTLDILVGLYRQAENSALAKEKVDASSVGDVIKLDKYKQKIEELEEIIRENKKVFLEIDTLGGI